MEKTVETWQNTTGSLVVTMRTDALGQVTKVQTKGGQRLVITPEDRELNQEQASKAKYDPFQNGLLAPIKLVDEQSAEKASTNPNQLTDDQVQELLSAPAKKFADTLLSINSEPVLRRLRKVAREADVRPSRQEAIQSRLEEIAPKSKIESGKV